MKLKYPNLELLELKTKITFDKCNLSSNDLVAEVFPQLWSSTALGFGGIGGQAMTTAYTTVFYNSVSFKAAAVYFDNELAYVIDNPNETFWVDVSHHNMKSVDKAIIMYNKPKEIKEGDNIAK